MKPCNGITQEIAVGEGVPTGIACEDARRIRNECTLGRFHLLDEFQKILGWVAFNVEFDSNRISDFIDIRAPYMALVRTRVNGDSFGTKSHAINRGLTHVGIVATTCVTQGGKLVDIYA